MFRAAEGNLVFRELDLNCSDDARLLGERAVFE